MLTINLIAFSAMQKHLISWVKNNKIFVTDTGKNYTKSNIFGQLGKIGFNKIFCTQLPLNQIILD